MLHGIPYGVKDLLAYKGAPTTWGAAPYRDRVIDQNATVIEKLQQQGAILLAKLSMVELAGGLGYDSADASFTGPGRCPWDRNYWSGGSSSGSGSAVAAGLVCFAIGSETSGSIINPSSYCGVTGLRPTFGRISRYGAMALCWSLDKLGPMARSADCCGIVLNAISGFDHRDASSVDKSFSHAPISALPKKKKYRLALIAGSKEGLMPAVKKNFESALEVLKNFAVIEEKEVNLPSLPFGQAMSTIVAVEGASAFHSLIVSGKVKELQNEKDRTTGFLSLMIPAVDYLQALRLRGRMKKEMHKIYESFDGLLCPSFATVAPPIEKDFSNGYKNFGSRSTGVIPAGNLVGQPGLALPTGFGDHHLPTSMTITGRIWSEPTLLTLGQLYQMETKFHLEQPHLTTESDKEKKSTNEPKT